MTTKTARFIFDFYSDYFNNFTKKEVVVEDFLETAIPFIYAGFKLNEKCLLLSSEQELIQKALDITLEVLEKTNCHKLARRLIKKNRRSNRKLFFIISDKNQVMRITRNFFSALTDVLETNIALAFFGESRLPEFLDKRVYFVKGADKAAKFLNMDLGEFIDRTNKIFGEEDA